MSRRFGRNQKRRMREAIATAEVRVDQLERANAYDRGLLRHQSAKLDAAEEWTREVAALVGETAIAAGEPATMKFKYAGDKIQLNPTSMPSFSMDDTSDFLRYETLRYETLRLLDVIAVRDAVGRGLHIRAELADGVVRYGISEHALATFSEEFLVRSSPASSSPKFVKSST